MSKPNGNSSAKGNSGNTNGGTETSFTKTPQAKDDALGTPLSGQLDYANNVYLLDVMANDLGGKSKWLWSVDDGINNSGAMDGYEAGDLLTQDHAGITGLEENRSQFGASLSVTADGQVAYDVSTISGTTADDLTELALGDTLTDSFIYAIRMTNGTLSWAKASVTLTGVNDDPTVAAVSLTAIEDGDAVTGSFVGDDVDSDDTPSSLKYNIVGTPGTGTLVNNGDGTFTFDPGSEFQSLAAGEDATFELSYTATDRHDAVSDPAALTITVTGTNDAPSLAAAAAAATEDGPTIAVDLTALGDDIDNFEDGSTLNYAITSGPAEGSASINGNKELVFDPTGAFQDLAENETSQVVVGVTATDTYGLTATNEVTITVTGTNDAPTLAAAVAAATEDGPTIAVDLTALGDDIDNLEDGSTLNYTITSGPAEGSASINGNKELVFDPTGAFQDLAKNETRQVVVGVTATDTYGLTATNEVTITVTGTNDAPTLAAAVAAATEDGPSVTVDLAALGADVDSDNDGSNLDYTISSAPGEGSASVSGNQLTINPDVDFQDLAAGESRNVVVGVTATDAHGTSATSNVTVTVTGTNDAPEITGGVASASITMNPVQAPFTVEQWTGYQSDQLTNLKAYAANNAPNYTVSTNVIDFTDDPAGFAGELPGSSPWPAAQATGTTGTGGINDTFFARISSNIVITQADTYTFRTFNDDGVFLSINNQQIISNSGYFPETGFEGDIYLEPGVYPLELYFYEGGGEASLELSYKNSSGIYQLVGNRPLNASGTLTFDDVDLSDTHTVTSAAVDAGTVGTLIANIAADTTGSGTGGQVSWSYELSGSEQQQLQSLAAGETAVQEFTVTVSDGNGGTDTQTVSVTIEGVNDSAVLGNAVANLTETNEQLTTSGTLSITDVDNGEASFNAQTNTPGTYGSFSIDANGDWNFASDGAQDVLEDGEVVTDIFNVTSLDGTATTVTVNITGTPDGPTATADNNSLTASLVDSDTGNTVYWVDWTSVTVDSQVGGRNPTYTVQGTITLSDRTIGVTYHGQVAESWGSVPGVQLSGGTDFFVTKNSNVITSTEGVGVFTGPAVGNGPTNNDIIRLHHADSPRTLTFSEPVENLFFAIVSMNNNGYIFDQDFDVVASADSSTDSGYFGWAEAWAKTNPEPGRYGITTDPNITGVSGMTEFHGVLAINNALESLTWESQADEHWNAFTIGTYGVAQSATVTGNVLSNDNIDTGALNSTIEVTAVDGNTIVGNSVTLTLASGAILKVDSDGDYLYDDNGQFESLADGDSFTETVEYTITDSRGYSDTATLSIVVNGVNDAPEAIADSASVNEDSSVTIDVLANDTDPDSGDSLTIASKTNGSNGTVAIVNNQLVYTPNADFHGADSFSYVVTDALGATSTASVEVTVLPVADTYVVSNLIQNGSFENGLNSWASSQINYIGDWQAADGSKTLDLNAENGGGYVEQTIATVAGEQYVVGFALSKNPGSASETLRVTAAGDSQDYVFNAGNTTSNMLWEKHTFTFVADSASTTVRLASADAAGGTDAWGPALDEVVAVTNRIITGFDKALGDKLDLSGLLSSINAPSNNTAFSGGFLDFQASGSDTLVRIDADGGADDYLTVVTLVGVSLSETDTGNFIL